MMEMEMFLKKSLYFYRDLLATSGFYCFPSPVFIIFYIKIKTFFLFKMNQSHAFRPIIITSNFSSVAKLDPKSVEEQNQENEKRLNDVKKKHPEYVCWSLLSMVIFLPMFFLWFPALVYAIKCKTSYCKFDLVNASWYSNLARFYNILCLILGILFYLNALTIFPMFFTRDYTYHIPVIIVPTVFVFVLHLLRILIIKDCLN